MANKWIIQGRLGQDPEVRYTPSGVAVVNFSVATVRSWKDKDTGEKVEQVEWVPVVCFGKRAEVIGEYFSKGKMIYVEGRSQTRSWEPDDGIKRYKTELVLEQFEFCGDKKGDGYTPSEKDYPGAPGTDDKPFGGTQAPEDDDIPF
jgi:single-strand DNA-binding protein